MMDGGDDDTSGPTENELAVAEALDDFVENGGVLPLGFAVLALSLTPDELAAALSQLSGEVATAPAPSSFQAMDSFLDLVLGSRSNPAIVMAPPTPFPDAPPERATVSVLGYGPVPTAADRTPAAFTSIVPDPRPWDVWVAAFGGYGKTDGDDWTGTHTREADEYGLAAGVDYQLTPNTTVGLAIGTSRGSFELSDDLGEGGSDMFQVAVTGRTQYEAAYLLGALAYGYNDVWTDRTVTIAGNDRFTADYTAHSYAAALEAGYQVGWITPFAGVRAQAFVSPDYSEQTVAGVSTFALDYDSRTATSLRSELGATVQWSTALPNAGPPQLEPARCMGARVCRRQRCRRLTSSSWAKARSSPSGEQRHRGIPSCLSAAAELSNLGAFYVGASVDDAWRRTPIPTAAPLKVGMRW